MVNPVIKSMFWKLVENSLEDASSEWIKEWLNGEQSLVDEFLIPDGEGTVSKDDLLRWKSQILQLLDSITVDEMREHCISAKPNFEEKFKEEKTEEILKQELKSAKNYLKGL